MSASVNSGDVSPCTRDIDPPVTHDINPHCTGTPAAGNSSAANLPTAPAVNPPLRPLTPSVTPLNPSPSGHGDAVNPTASAIMVHGYESDYQLNPSPPPYSPLTPVMK